MRKPTATAVCCSENGTAFTNSRSIICVYKRNSPKLKSCSAWLADPIVAAICRSEDRSTFADSRSVRDISEGNGPQSFCCAAGLNCPAVSAIRCPHDRPVFAHDCASVRIHKGSASKIVALRKRILPVPLRTRCATLGFARESSCCPTSSLSSMDGEYEPAGNCKAQDSQRDSRMCYSHRCYDCMLWLLVN